MVADLKKIGAHCLDWHWAQFILHGDTVAGPDKAGDGKGSHIGFYHDETPYANTGKRVRRDYYYLCPERH